MNKDLHVNISTSCILVVTPLTSITSDQIEEMESLGLKALELSDKTVNEIIQSRPQFIYCSAENATST
jgi:superfamily II DNA helicase RecQ